MLDKPLIEKKLRRIEELLRELTAVEVRTIDEFKEQTVTKRFIERNIELTVEQMIDICKHFVSGMDLSEPETYSECFDILAKERVIPEHNLNTFKSMVRFRNLLIHAYDGVDDTITYAIYKKRLNDFRIFVSDIRAHIQALT